MIPPRPPEPVVFLYALAGLLGSAAVSAEPLTGIRTVHLAIAHDYLLPGETAPLHRLPPAPAQFDATGALRGFADAGPVLWASEQAVGHSGNDGMIAWGRWGHGRTGGSGHHGHYDITGGEGARNALYYVAGLPAQRLPAGVRQYTLLGGGIAPTAGEGGMAVTTSLDAGELRADLAAGRAEVKLKLTVPSGTYELHAQNLTLRDGLLGTGPDSTISVTGVFCFAGCRAELSGFLAGPQGQRAGMAYHIDVAALSEDPNGVVAWTLEDGAPP